MQTRYFFYLVILIVTSCTSSNQITYLKDLKLNTEKSIDSNVYEQNIQKDDILKIDIYSQNPEASIIYNKISVFNKSLANNLEILKLEGYLVDHEHYITLPILGKVNTKAKTTLQLESEIRRMLLEGNHLINPVVSVRHLNSKFTVLGEVKMPGTYSFNEKFITIFQALGYAGDLSISGKRKNITLIREVDGIRTTLKVDLTDQEIFNSPSYYIKNNDVLIVNPSYSKVKSAGFIGSPASIASLASLLLSITLLIINNN